MKSNSTICITTKRKSGIMRSAAPNACGGRLLPIPVNAGQAGAAAVESADPSGILRGLGWGLVIEVTAALLAYGMWQSLWHFAFTVRP